jgi:molecular chaperone HscB
MSRNDRPPATPTTDARHLCWACHEESGAGPFCHSCVKIQPIDQLGGYFELFGTVPTYAVDIAVLRNKFYELSRRLHPDFYAGNSEAEKELARNNSAYLNAAFRTLVDPIRRAEYLLSTRAGGYASNPTPPQDLFEEILEIGELLVDSDLSAGDRIRLAQAGKAFRDRQDAWLASLTDLFPRLLAGDMAIRTEIEARLNNIKYLRTILSRIDRRVNDAA